MGDYSDKTKPRSERLTRMLPRVASLEPAIGVVAQAHINEEMAALAYSRRDRDRLRTDRSKCRSVAPELLASHVTCTPVDLDGIIDAYMRQHGKSVTDCLAIQLAMIMVCGVDISDSRLMRIAEMAGVGTGHMAAKVEHARRWCWDQIHDAARRFSHQLQAEHLRAEEGHVCPLAACV